MILQQSQNASCKYLIADSIAPPTVFSWELMSPANVSLRTGSVSMPTVRNCSSLSMLADPGEVSVVLASGATWPYPPGSVARLVDAYGYPHDVISRGYTSATRTLLLAEYGGPIATPTNVWCPEITIPITGTDIATLGDGYSLRLTYTISGTVYRDTIWFGVAPYASRLTISMRDLLNYFPDAATKLQGIQRRWDWTGVNEKACELVESKIRAMDMWYSAILSPTGYRRAVAAAIHRALAPSLIPDGMSIAPDEWIRMADGSLNEAVRDLMSAARYDSAGLGHDSAEVLPAQRTTYKVL